MIQEVERGFQGTADGCHAILQAVRQAVADEHGLDAYAVVLIKTGSLCKTTSGKVQRRACRTAFVQDELNVVAQWRERPAAATAQIRAWLVARLAELLHIHPDELRPHEPFTRHGLNSAAAVGLTGELAEWLGRPLAATLLYEYPSIELLARHLAGEHAVPRPGDTAPPAPGEPIAIIGMAGEDISGLLAEIGSNGSAKQAAPVVEEKPEPKAEAAAVAASDTTVSKLATAPPAHAGGSDKKAVRPLLQGLDRCTEVDVIWLAGDDECGHGQITLASFLSLATSVATSGTLMPALRLGGSLTFRVLMRGATSTPRSAGLTISSVFFFAFMMLGRVT